MVAIDLPPVYADGLSYYKDLPLVEHVHKVSAITINKLGGLAPVFKSEDLSSYVGFGLPHRHFALGAGQAVVWGVHSEMVASSIQTLDPSRHLPLVYKARSYREVIPLEYIDLGTMSSSDVSAIVAKAALIPSIASGLVASGEHQMVTLTLMPALISDYLSRLDRPIGLLDIMAYEQSDEISQSSWLTFSRDRWLGTFDSLWVFHPDGRIVLAGQCTPSCGSLNGCS